MRSRIVLTVLVVGMVGLSGVAFASHQFRDVPDDHVFHEDIEWMRDTGLTRGCNPPANDRYCPDDPVTRGQMAAFLHRFADRLGDVVGGGDGEGGVGPQGPKAKGDPGPGEKGDKGDPRPTGPAGQSLVGYEITNINSDYGGVRVVDVERSSRTAASPTPPTRPSWMRSSSPRTACRIEGTAQFFDFGEPEVTTSTTTVSPDLPEREPLGSTWTPDIPNDGNNAAQGYGAVVVEAKAGDEVTLRRWSGAKQVQAPIRRVPAWSSPDRRE